MADLKKINLRSKGPIQVDAFLDVTDPNSPTVLTLPEEEELDKDKLPKHIIKLTSTWRRVNFTLLNLIEMNQYVDKIVQGRLQRVFDVQALIIARIRVLLQSWTLSEIDETLVLELEASVDNKDIKIIGSECMKRIGELDPPAIINVFYNKAMDKIFPEEGRLLKNLREEESKE